MEKIRVIDDDLDMRMVLSKYLLKFNYQVIEASSGKSALDILEKGQPDLILCDFKLGDMNGTALLTKIKENYAHIPVIFITGYGDIKIAVEVMRLGAYDYVTKPLFPEEILLTIRKALTKKEKIQTKKKKKKSDMVQSSIYCAPKHAVIGLTKSCCYKKWYEGKKRNEEKK